MTNLQLDDPRDTLKMIRETLCVSQALFSLVDPKSVAKGHQDRLSRIIKEIDRQRPLGPDGKHGSLHTETCGCEDK